MRPWEESKITSNPRVWRLTRNGGHAYGQRCCIICPPFLGENWIGKRHPRPDRYKSARKGRC